MGEYAAGHWPRMADPLDVYRRKRDFARTPEPAGAVAERLAPAGERRFVVQRHRASRLHYDLRFEIDGVLVSWAVPKGPTLDPDARRLAVHVEDHPVEYLHFEGVIPAGEYGGGDVVVWDTGTWDPVHTDDPGAAVRAGELHVEVHGQKLRGRLVLVRRGEARDEHEQWMLLHKRDEHAVPGWEPEDHPRSVLSGRSNPEVAAEPAQSWRSDAPAAEAAVAGPGAAPGDALPDIEPAGAIESLQDLGSGGTWEVWGRSLKVTNLDKVLFPAPPDGSGPAVTKRELLAYAARIAPVALPYLRGRPLNMHRYPDGVGAAGARAGFWHKQRPSHAPAWLRCWENPDADEGETTAYVVPDEPAALVWVANFGALEWHPWTSRVEDPHQPTYALVDLDPGERTTWDELLALARLHRTALDHLGVLGCPKVTGRRGLQVWIPVRPGYSFDDTRGWVERLSRTVGRVLPELVSWKWEVKARGGLARLDYTQNAINKTLVAPYSPRPAAGAPVSVPITWDELDDPGLRPDRWTLRTVLDRLVERGDPFRLLLGVEQDLPPIS